MSCNRSCHCSKIFINIVRTFGQHVISVIIFTPLNVKVLLLGTTRIWILTGVFLAIRCY